MIEAVNSVVATVANLMPDNGDASIIASNKAAIASATTTLAQTRATIHSIRTGPVRDAREEMRRLGDIMPPPPPGAPSCTLTATPSSIPTGGSTPLLFSWTTTNATSGIIDHNVGAMTPIGSGSRTLTPGASALYTATVTRSG